MINVLSSLSSGQKTRRKPYTKVVLEISLRICILVAAYVSAVWSAQHRHISKKFSKISEKSENFAEIAI